MPEAMWTSTPICSMYGIFTYIWVISRANVGKYSIHGAYGSDDGNLMFDEMLHTSIYIPIMCLDPFDSLKRVSATIATPKRCSLGNQRPKWCAPPSQHRAACRKLG